MLMAVRESIVAAQESQIRRDLVVKINPPTLNYASLP